MGIGGSGGSIWSNPLVLALFAIGIGAFVFGLLSMARAWQLASRHRPFMDLGVRRWMMGYAVLPYMPEESMVYVRRHFISVITTVASLLALIAVVWIDGR
jgi:hypothetical protein